MRLLVVALAGALLLTACGKKAPLRPPPSGETPAAAAAEAR
jgi:predicted small lipoprotein YifL